MEKDNIEDRIIDVLGDICPKFDAVFDDILSQHALTNGYLSDIANYNKKMFNSFTDYLQQIVNNTKNL